MGKYYKLRKTKSGYLICAVPMCQTKKSTTTLKTFEFPSDIKRRSQWIAAIVEATLKNEEEKSIQEDLYALENRRMELEMDISNLIGDHSYVCARHFRPGDIVVHPNVCRLTANAVPSVFKNYPTELPRQFFKKICQTAQNISDDSTSALKELNEQNEFDNVSDDSNLQEIMVYESDGAVDDNLLKTEVISISTSSNVNTHTINSTDDVDDIIDIGTPEDCEYYIVKGSTNTKLKTACSSKPNLTRNKLKKKIRSLELRYKNLQTRFNELENKHKLYNISFIERDAENKNEEAIFLLDMLKSYVMFEKTREEMLKNIKKE